SSNERTVSVSSGPLQGTTAGRPWPSFGRSSSAGVAIVSSLPECGFFVGRRFGTVAAGAFLAPQVRQRLAESQLPQCALPGGVRCERQTATRFHIREAIRTVGPIDRGGPFQQLDPEFRRALQGFVPANRRGGQRGRALDSRHAVVPVLIQQAHSVATPSAS